MNRTQASVAGTSPIEQAIVSAPAVDRARTWRRTTVVSAACATVLDGALLQRKHALFTGGFLANHHLATPADGAVFLMLSVLLNATIAAPLVFGALLAGRRLGLGPRSVRFVAFCTAMTPLATANFVTYKVWAYLGDAFDFHVMYALSGHRISEVFAVTAPLMTRPLFVAAIACLALAGLTWCLQRFDCKTAAAAVLPSVPEAVKSCLLLLCAASALVTAVSLTSNSMSYGLRGTPAGQLFTVVLNRLTDFDRDGFGLLRPPRDPAPFDASIHPYALDIPGNGIDENGLAGDLPLAWATYEDPPLPQGPWPERPPVILCVLESVRADTIGAHYNGVMVTPIMSALAATGISINSAWSHTGSTSQSRYHILAGSLLDGRGSRTLLDDFKDQGYDVAYFSGQDDDFGGMGLDFGRLDRYYDARQDVGRRYSASTTPGSLAVPADVVETRIREYLAGRQSAAPLFLYVNLHDTHYPYHHGGLDNLLEIEPLRASLISPARRWQLLGTYLNATANVDRAIGRVIGAVERHVGRPAAVVIIGDHGESLFEDGILGHGFALNEVQTRIPLIVRGLSMKMPLPFGQVDLRRAMNEALAGGDLDARAVAVRSRSARVFQYVGTLDRPGQIGWMSADGTLTYDFRSGQVGLWDTMTSPRDLVGEPRRLFHELVYAWEGKLLARSERATLLSSTLQDQAPQRSHGGRTRH